MNATTNPTPQPYQPPNCGCGWCWLRRHDPQAWAIGRASGSFAVADHQREQR